MRRVLNKTKSGAKVADALKELEVEGGLAGKWRVLYEVRFLKTQTQMYNLKQMPWATLGKFCFSRSSHHLYVIVTVVARLWLLHLCCDHMVSVQTHVCCACVSSNILLGNLHWGAGHCT